MAEGQRGSPDSYPALPWLQIRRALQQLLFPSKAFSWPRHVAIALILLILVNVLVICVPTIRDIFGFIGQYHQPQFLVLSNMGLAFKLRLIAVPFCPSGSTSAPSLIFILPSVFYLRLVPSEVEPLSSWPKIQVSILGKRAGERGTACSKMTRNERNIVKMRLGGEGTSRKRVRHEEE